MRLNLLNSLILIFAAFATSKDAVCQTDQKIISVNYLNQEAEKFFKLKDFEKAANLYQSAYILDSTQYVSLIYKSIANYAFNKKNTIFEDVEKSANLNNNKPLSFFIAGKALQDIDSINFSIIMYDSAIALNSSYAEAYNNRGLAYERLKDYDKAEIEFNSAAKHDSSVAGYFMNIGRILRTKKNSTAAIEAFTKSLSLNPKFIPAYLQRGDARAESSDYFRAIVDYSKVLEYQNNNSEAYLKRGVCEISVNMKPEGCSDIQKALDLGNKLAIKYLEKYCKNK